MQRQWRCARGDFSAPFLVPFLKLPPLLSQALPQTSFLDLTDAHGLSAAGLSAALQRLPQLRGLRLNGGRAVSFPPPPVVVEPPGAAAAALAAAAAAAAAAGAPPPVVLPPMRPPAPLSPPTVKPKVLPSSILASGAPPTGSFRLSNLLADMAVARAGQAPTPLQPAALARPHPLLPALPAAAAAVALVQSPRGGGAPPPVGASGAAAAAGPSAAGAQSQQPRPPPDEEAALVLAHVIGAPPHLLTGVGRREQRR